MNILISCMGYDGGKSGLSSYMKNVIQELQNSPHNITLVVEADSVSDFEKFNKIVVPHIFSKSIMGMLWHFFILPFYTLSRKYDCVLILAGSRRYLAFSPIPRIGVIHDLSPYHIKKKYDPLRMFYLHRLQPILGKKLDKIVAISESTRSDIQHYWRIPKELITINYNGLNQLPPPDNQIQSKLNLNHYILYVSRIEHPGKNHIGLVKAYEALPNSFKLKYKLVLAGSDWSGAEIVKTYIEKSPDKKNIVLTGFVTAKELSSLYHNASLFVFPSFFEGFGLPLLEAMSVSVPCICSHNSSLAEIGGNAVLTFDPNDIRQICDSIQNVLNNPELANQLIKNGLQRISLFDWKTHAKTLIDLCQQIYQTAHRL